MLWRAQRITQCSHSWSRALQSYRQPATFLPFTFPGCSQSFASTSRQPQHNLRKPLVPSQDTDSSSSRLDTSPSDDPIRETIPSFSHAQLLREEYQHHEIFNDEIRLAGLVQSIRKQKRAAFAHILDGSTLNPFQAVLSPAQAEGVTNGSYVQLIGMWQKSLGQGQDRELQVQRVECFGPSDPEQYPIQKKYRTQEYLRAIPHMRLRAPLYSLVARARAGLTGIICGQLANASVLQVHPPLITSSDCEGAGEVFTISPHLHTTSVDVDKEPQQYFREPKYLTVSSQLHLEAYCAELGDVFALSPTFRAEESDTSRHLSEFYMLEAEHRGIQALEVLLDKVEGLIKSSVAAFRISRPGKELLQYYDDQKHRGADEQVDLESRWSRLEDSAIASAKYNRIPHQHVVKCLLKAEAAASGTLFRTKPSYTNGLQLEHERWVVDNLGEGRPVFVTHYPKAVKPFYMLPSSPQCLDEGVDTVECFDLLLPFGYCEVAGGSLREHRLDNLVVSMRERGMLKARDPGTSTKDAHYPFIQPDEDLGHLKWYADLRRFGTSPHGGYGLGLDRLLAYLTGVSNVRDVVAFPRTWGRADC